MWPHLVPCVMDLKRLSRGLQPAWFTKAIKRATKPSKNQSWTLVCHRTSGISYTLHCTVYILQVLWQTRVRDWFLEGFVARFIAFVNQAGCKPLHSYFKTITKGTPQGVQTKKGTSKHVNLWCCIDFWSSNIFSLHKDSSNEVFFFFGPKTLIFGNFVVQVAQ